MFKTTRTLYLREDHVKSVIAIMNALGLKIKCFRDLNRSYCRCIFKGSEKDVTNVCTRLDKYGIEHAFF